MRNNNYVTPVLRDPSCVTHYSLPEWDALLRQARRADLSAHLYGRLHAAKLIGKVPAAALPYLETAWQLHARQREAVNWELSALSKTLREFGFPIILLKGAAYYAADLPAAQGRVLSDIDLLVPPDSIEAIEAIFIRQGWVSSHLNAYDQRYYRQWMHEIPPLEHPKRGTVLDIHHAIMPLTARVRPDMDALRKQAKPLDRPGRFAVLAPTDMVLHSAAHLFYDSEWGHGLRDLVDLDALLRDFQKQADFWMLLQQRADQVGLARVLYYALAMAKRLLGTPIPDDVLRTATHAAPPTPMRHLILWLFVHALVPHHPSCMGFKSRLANFALFVRGHWLRMPMHLLVPHLFRKAFIKPAETA